MKQQIVVHLNYGILLSNKKEQTGFTHTTTWVNLKGIMLSDGSRSRMIATVEELI